MTSENSRKTNSQESPVASWLMGLAIDTAAITKKISSHEGKKYRLLGINEDDEDVPPPRTKSKKVRHPPALGTQEVDTSPVKAPDASKAHTHHVTVSEETTQPSVSLSERLELEAAAEEMTRRFRSPDLHTTPITPSHTRYKATQQQIAAYEKLSPVHRQIFHLLATTQDSVQKCFDSLGISEQARVNASLQELYRAFGIISYDKLGRVVLSSSQARRSRMRIIYKAINPIPVPPETLPLFPTHNLTEQPSPASDTAKHEEPVDPLEKFVHDMKNKINALLAGGESIIDIARAAKYDENHIRNHFGQLMRQHNLTERHQLLAYYDPQVLATKDAIPDFSKLREDEMTILCLLAKGESIKQCCKSVNKGEPQVLKTIRSLCQHAKITPKDDVRASIPNLLRIFHHYQIQHGIGSNDPTHSLSVQQLCAVAHATPSLFREVTSQRTRIARFHGLRRPQLG